MLAPILLLLAGCDYSGDWLFAQATDVPGVIHLGELTPAVVESRDDIRAATMYSMVGATGTAEQGGVTFTFTGTGSAVCVFVDPETAFWSESTAINGGDKRYEWPDNTQDDGDIDLFAGFSVYYTGSPGERAGDFEITYEDSLGNEVPIELNECVINGLFGTGGHAGRGAPEYCTLAATQPGVSYTVLLQTFSTPLDDNRLGYGLLVVDGPCDDMLTTAGADHEECVITGESIDPNSYELDENGLMTSGSPRAGSEAFEAAFCASGKNKQNRDLRDYCEAEWEGGDCDSEYCYCGDPRTSPNYEAQ